MRALGFDAPVIVRQTGEPSVVENLQLRRRQKHYQRVEAFDVTTDHINERIEAELFKFSNEYKNETEIVDALLRSIFATFEDSAFVLACYELDPR